MLLFVQRRTAGQSGAQRATYPMRAAVIRLQPAYSYLPDRHTLCQPLAEWQEVPDGPWEMRMLV